MYTVFVSQRMSTLRVDFHHAVLLAWTRLRTSPGLSGPSSFERPTRSWRRKRKSSSSPRPVWRCAGARTKTCSRRSAPHRLRTSSSCTQAASHSPSGATRSTNFSWRSRLSKRARRLRQSDTHPHVEREHGQDYLSRTAHRRPARRLRGFVHRRRRKSARRLR